jgi:hypothetical protein
MRPILTALFRCLAAVALLVPVAVMTTSPAAAASTIAATTTCSNGVDNSGGLGLICQVTVVNTIAAGVGYATVTVHECHGAAGAPSAACTDTTTVLTETVTAVTQCNDSINGGGGTLRCSVQVTSNFYGLSPGSTAVTVNQCVGSGGGITTGCNPVPASTTGAAITQCNGSANGGTLVGMTCTATGTMASGHALTVNQCNGSANGGGALVICSTSLINNALSGTPPLASAPPLASTSSPASAPSPASSSPANSSPASSSPPTSTFGDSSSGKSTPPDPLMILLALAGMALATVAVQRRRIRS